MSFFPIKKEFEHLTNISLPRKPVNDIVIGGIFFFCMKKLEIFH